MAIDDETNQKTYIMCAHGFIDFDENVFHLMFS